ncbi:MAG: hypothetical protein QM730_24020 [Anaerolineales bacterium]
MDQISSLMDECARFQRELDEAQFARQTLLDSLETYHAGAFFFRSVRVEAKALSSEFKKLSLASRDALTKTRNSLYKTHPKTHQHDR